MANIKHILQCLYLNERFEQCGYGMYVYNDVVLPLLCTGISRFEGGGKSKEALLRCMLCTLDSSGIDLTSKTKIVIYGDAKDIPLYEYKDMFRAIPRR